MTAFLEKGTRAKFSLMQVTYWCSIAAMSAFAVAYVRAQGMSAAHIGIMMAVFKLSAVVAQFFWGAVCDKYQANKGILILTNFLMIASSMAFYFSRSAAGYILGYALMGFLQSPTASNLDTWILKKFYGDGQAYGPIRSMGSLGYGVFIFCYGILIANVGYSVMPWFMAGFALLTFAVALVTAPPEKITSIGKSSAVTKEELFSLIGNKTYLFLLLILFFEGAAVFSLAQMKALIWEDLNASIAYQGYDGCICAIAQFPVFMMASRFNRISPYKRLLIAVAMDLGMFIIDYFARIPQLIVVGSVLNGVAYAFMVASFREIIQKNTSYKLSTTAQGIGDAFYMSLSGVFGSLLSGWLADLFGMKPMILTLALLQLIPLTLCFFFFRRAKRLGEANP